MKRRTCTQCGETKPLNREFWFVQKSGFKSECKECSKLRTKRNYEANAELRREAARLKRAENPDYGREYQRNFREKNPELANARTRRWREKYPERVKASVRKSYEKQKRERFAEYLLVHTKSNAAKQKRVVDIDVAFIESLYDLQGGRCYYTNIPLDFDPKRRNPYYPSVDRIDSTCGYTRDNVVLACWWANMAKNSYSENDFKAILAAVRSAA